MSAAAAKTKATKKRYLTVAEAAPCKHATSRTAVRPACPFESEINHETKPCRCCDACHAGCQGDV